MWPAIRHGDVLLVARGQPVMPGDVVLTRALTGGGLVAHRLAAIADDSLRCANARGDLDPWLPASALWGRVAAVERAGRLIAVKHDPRGVRMLWRLRWGYGVVRRLRHKLWSPA